jgi:hypothetical protein
MLWSAMIWPTSIPSSCSGKNVDGTSLNRATFSATIAISSTPTSSAWSSTAVRDREYAALKRSNARSVHIAQRARECSAAPPRSVCAHIAGVTVSDTTSEIRIAIDSVTANSWNSLPTIPGISRIGMNTAISDRLIEITVKLTSALPRIAASRGGTPASRCRTTFSSTTTASSTTKPVAIVSAISDRLSRL